MKLLSFDFMNFFLSIVDMGRYYYLYYGGKSNVEISGDYLDYGEYDDL